MKMLLADRFSRATVERTLMKLYHKQYVDRIQPPYRNDSIIYEIRDSGMRKVREDIPEATNLIRIKNINGPTNFEHSMMMCRFLQNLEPGVKKKEHRLLYQSQLLALDPARKDNSLAMPSQIRHRFDDGHVETYDAELVPDIVVGIKYPSAGTERLLVVEIENTSVVFRNNFQNSSSLRKMLCYKNIYEAGHIKLLKMKRSKFTAVFVYPTAHDAKRACDLAVKLFGETDLFLFGVQDTKVLNEETGTYSNPRPNPELYTTPMLRAGLDPISLADFGDYRKPPPN
jgi:hypothetical protein